MFSIKQKLIASAPLIIVNVADLRVRIKDTAGISLQEDSDMFEVKQIIRDTSIAVEHIVLEAVHQGLGSCWVAWFTQNEIRSLLSIPEDKFVVSILTVGYPDEFPKPRPRKELGDIIHRNKW